MNIDNERKACYGHWDPSCNLERSDCPCIDECPNYTVRRDKSEKR